MTLIPSPLVGVLVLLAVPIPVSAAVRHVPQQPSPGQPVLVTAELPAGTAHATLKLQAVAPGKYIRKADPAYEKEWVDLPLRDDGKDGDAKAGDSVFSVAVPVDWQKHRWLMRYRIESKDAAGKSTRLPAAADPCPNFAWWCDAGPAAWAGAITPGKSPVLQFSPEFLGTLQSLHLIARAGDVAKSQWDPGAHKQRQQGTLVYRGVVYDHIEYSNRGQGSAHIGGKNKWAVKLGAGSGLRFLDHDGVPFPAPVKGLDLNPGGSTPYLPTLRGITGLDEVMSMRAYRLAGVPTAPVTWVQWRVVTTEQEVSAKDQFAGDLWGVYVALGEMEPELLADRGLPNGLAASVQSGIKHAPKSVAEPDKVWEKFRNAIRGKQTEAWWRENLDLPAYFSFAAMNRLLGNVDLRPDGNHGYYRNPDGHWSPIPWDNDMMFVPRHHQPGYIDANNCLQHPAIAREYRNRAREILNLFAGDATEQGGQVGQFTADLAAAIAPPKYPADWSLLDAAVWNQHPRQNQKGSYFVNPVYGDHFGGRWKRTLATNDFAGFRKYLVDFCTDSRPTKNYAPNDGDPRGYGWGYLAYEAKDPKIPATAKVERAAGDPWKFTASAFASPGGKSPAALEWRVGRVGKLGWYELTDHWRSEVANGVDVAIPPKVFDEPGAYRVRARWRDDSGRCGHWSPALEIRVKG
ncbi:MAG TPA: CotH kinase family protein [Tepidisphaeraceae bacterium]|nr:CotH kinase family protein [Tepidisphaeraceae bacterium]